MFAYLANSSGRNLMCCFSSARALHHCFLNKELSFWDSSHSLFPLFLWLVATLVVCSLAPSLLLCSMAVESSNLSLFELLFKQLDSFSLIMIRLISVELAVKNVFKTLVIRPLTQQLQTIKG